jgi:hypothetical protein
MDKVQNKPNSFVHVKVMLMTFKSNTVVGLDKLKIDASVHILYSSTEVCLKQNELYMRV